MNHCVLKLSKHYLINSLSTWWGRYCFGKFVPEETGSEKTQDWLRAAYNFKWVNLKSQMSGFLWIDSILPSHGKSQPWPHSGPKLNLVEGNGTSILMWCYVDPLPYCISNLPKLAARPYLRNVGLVFQEYKLVLVPWGLILKMGIALSSLLMAVQYPNPAASACRA